MIKVGIVGAAGYGGSELLRLIQGHPLAEVSVAISQTYSGQPVTASLPGLIGRTELVFSGSDDWAKLQDCDVVFLAEENGKAMNQVAKLLQAGCKVIDLSADFRFRDVETYEAWYSPHNEPQLSKEAAYGLPEWNRETIQNARLVGNPGCFATAIQLALAPLIKHQLIRSESLIADGKSGISGAGRAKFAADYHFPEANENVSAYKIAGTHRHTPEVEESLSRIAGQPIQLSFTPHLVPMTRGILATCYADLIQGTSPGLVMAVYNEHYESEPFVHLVQNLPSTKMTIGTNNCLIGFGIDSRMNRITIVSCLDNLLKGMAGTALQNMNLMCGIDETAGLAMGGIWP